MKIYSNYMKYRYLLILVILVLSLDSFSQPDKKEPSNLNTNEIIWIEHITVSEFVEELRISKHRYSNHSILTVAGQQDTNWITKDDIEFLMTLIDSQERAKCIVMVISSYLPSHNHHTLGDQVLELINAYRYKEVFPSHATHCCDSDVTLKESIKKWWEVERRK